QGGVLRYLSTESSSQQSPGNYPTALAQTTDGKRLFVADSSFDAIAVFDTAPFVGDSGVGKDIQSALGFIPTDWYPSALAVHGDDLIIATAKGEGARPNKD